MRDDDERCTTKTSIQPNEIFLHGSTRYDHGYVRSRDERQKFLPHFHALLRQERNEWIELRIVAKTLADPVRVALILENLIGPFASVLAKARRAVEDILPGGIVGDFVDDQNVLHEWFGSCRVSFAELPHFEPIPRYEGSHEDHSNNGQPIQLLNLRRQKIGPSEEPNQPVAYFSVTFSFSVDFIFNRLPLYIDK